MKLNFYSKLLFAASLSVIINQNGFSQTVKILFDATKGEMAGNGDWVIDYDATTLGVGSSGTYLTSSGHQSNPQRIPTPAQSGITSSTAETYWSGALSSWAVDCAKKGYTVETLPWNASITYGNSSNVQDLSNYKIYIIDEPQEKFTTAEKTAIMQFVQNGGRLFMISDHTGSDRNGDGWDSPMIWNDFLSNNGVHNYPFGIYFDLADFSGTSTNITASSTDSIIHGPMGSVTKVYWSSGTSMTLDPTANTTVKGVVYKSGTTGGGTTNALVAYARYGSGGKVAAIGDSSPPDDGTGNPTCTLYNGYWTDASGNHRLLLMNITIWLAETETTGIEEVNNGQTNVSFFPNPTSSEVNIKADNDLTNVHVAVYDMAGKVVYTKFLPMISKDEFSTFNLATGFYLVKLNSDQVVTSSKLSVH